MEKKLQDWQVPTFESDAAQRQSWIEEQIQDGDKWWDSQAVSKNAEQNLALLSADGPQKLKSNNLKSDIRKFVETIADETRGQPLDINALAPGAINTRLTDEVLALAVQVAHLALVNAGHVYLHAGVEGPVDDLPRHDVLQPRAHERAAFARLDVLELDDAPGLPVDLDVHPVLELVGVDRVSHSRRRV